MDVLSTNSLTEIDRKRLNVPLPESDPVLVVAENGQIVHMTHAAGALLAYTSEGVKGISFFSLVHQLNIYRVMRDISTMVFNGKEHAWWKIPLRTAGGHWLWVNIFVQNLLQTDAAILYLRLEEV